MAYVNLDKIVAEAYCGFSFLERRAIDGGKSHLCTSTRGSILPWRSRRAAVLGMLWSTDESKATAR
jgi:hypothetical protein